MSGLSLLHKIYDAPHRVFNLFRRIFLRASPFSDNHERSDSEGTFYTNAVNSIISSERKFERFRRHYDYREILEHVDFRLGKKYLEKIYEMDPDLNTAKIGIERNDSVGRPRMYKYPHFNRISPTTLRYLSVALDVDKEIKLQDVSKIVEIGAGYGGQAAVFDKLVSNVEYFIFDLPIVQTLIQKYLSNFDMKNVTFLNLKDDQLPSEYDLVISNYAFSELPRELQTQYVERVLVKSKNGYLIMNSGRGNSTGRSNGKVSLSELSKKIPELIVKEEDPQTSPDNYVVYWRDREVE